ncbi:MAG TPA: VCBS repeat-containing protein, partial [Thermoanaerobaculia bacterium]
APAHVPVDLPGAPAAVVAADVDGDGRRDLTVVVAYTRWDQITIEETAKMDDVEGLVEVMTIIPSLVDRREVRVYRGRPEGGFEPAGIGLPIDTSILSVEAGPPGLPVVALTDQGLSALRLRSGSLSWEPVLQERPVLAGTGTFVPNLGMVRDLDGDGRSDLLFPTSDGASVYLSGPEGLRPAPASRVSFPDDDLQPPDSSPLVRHYPLPEIRDVDGDRLPDLLFRHTVRGWRDFRVMRNLGGGRFSAAVAPLGEYRKPAADEPSRPSPVFFGDLDGDGRAEYVTDQEIEAEKESFREEMKTAKRRPVLYRLHRARPDLSMEPQPYQQLRAEGYAFHHGDGGNGGDGDGDPDFRFPGGFQDLNGDGLLDLVAMTLDFSMFQVVKVMTVQRLSLGLDFHVWCQATGGFKRVEGLDLSGKFNLNLRNLRLGELSQFAGDFDGDGRPDFLQIGRGRTVTIHRGRPDCSYPARPDLSIRLEEEPRDLGLVQVRDLDGDRRADLLVVQPRKPKRNEDRAQTLPVRLDLYLSGGAK